MEAVRDMVASTAAPSGASVGVSVVHAGVGPLTPDDVNLAAATGAHLLLFNVPRFSGRDVEMALRQAQAVHGTQVRGRGSLCLVRALVCMRGV